MSGSNGNGNGNGKRPYTTMRLSEARERTPPVPAVEAMRQQLQLALFGAVSESDVAAMAEKLKTMALDGDLKAMKMFFSLIDTRAAPPAQIVKIEQAVIQLQESVAQIRQVVVAQDAEEPAPLPALPVTPTSAVPRSEDKIAELERRAAAGEALFHPADGRHGNGDLS